MERHHQNGLEVARFLRGHPNVVKVNHPLLLEDEAAKELVLRQVQLLRYTLHDDDMFFH